MSGVAIHEKAVPVYTLSSLPPPILRATVQQPIFSFFVLSYTNGYPLPMTCRMTIPSSPTPFHGNPKQCCLITINRETLNRHCHGIMPPPQLPVCTSMPRHRQYGTERNWGRRLWDGRELPSIDTPPPKRKREKWSGKLLQIKLVVIIWIHASQSDCSRHMAPAQACDDHIYIISTENGMQPIKMSLLLTMQL